MGLNRSLELKVQLELLWNNCRDYDSGNITSAIEIATRLRVILHSTVKSTSALKHIQGEYISLLSTAISSENDDEKIILQEGLIRFTSSGIQASTYNSSNQHLLPYQKWWDEEVVAIHPKHRYTRKQIVTDTAHEGGGAHIVTRQKPRLSFLVKGPFKRVKVDEYGNEKQVPNLNHHYHYLRQIAYEVLHSTELFALVEGSFSLQTDEQLVQYIEHKRQARILDLSESYKVASKLSQTGGNKESRAILTPIIKELGKDVNELSAELYFLAKWTEAATYQLENIDYSIEMFELLITEMEELACSINSQSFADSYLTSHYVLGLMYAQKNKRLESEEHWFFVRDTCRQAVPLGCIPKEVGVLRTIYYFLESSNGIAVHALNRNEFEKVFNELESIFIFLKSVSLDITDDLNRKELETELGSKYGAKISQQIFKAAKNLAIAKLMLGDIEGANILFQKVKDKFQSSCNEFILNDISTTQKIFDKALD